MTWGLFFWVLPRVLIKINGNLAWSSVGDLLILKRCITLGIYSVQCLSREGLKMSLYTKSHNILKGKVSIILI